MEPGLRLSAIFLMLLSGEPGFIRTETVHEVSVGGNVTVGCQFNVRGHTSLFCKDDFEKKNILVETSENNKCKERYCIEYKANKFGYDVMYVSITNVTSSDSGRYQCVLKRYVINNGIQEFTIKVTKDAALNPTFTLKPEDPPNVTLTSTTDPTVQTGDTTPVITVTSTQQSLTQGPVSFHTPTQPEPHRHTLISGSTALYTGLALAAVAVLLAAALLIFYCNKGRSEQKAEPPGSAEKEQTPESNVLYEEIQDVKKPVEISTVYASASFSKPAEDQTSSDIYSLATAPAGQPQVEDFANELDYAEVDFPESGDLTVSGAPRSQTAAVLYSAVQTRTEDTHYSTVAAPQE